MSDANCLTPRGQLVFGVHLFDPYPKDDPKKRPTWNICMMFDKAAQNTPEFKAMKALEEEVCRTKFPKGPPKGYISPFRDDNEEYGFTDGEILINFKKFVETKRGKNRPPGVVDRNRKDMEDDGTIYSGGFGRVHFSAYAYDNESKGVMFGLENFMWLGGGEPFVQRKTAEQAFAGVENYAEDDVPDGGADDQLGF